MALALIRLRKNNKVRPEGTFRIPGKLSMKEAVAIVMFIVYLTRVCFLMVKEIKARQTES